MVRKMDFQMLHSQLASTLHDITTRRAELNKSLEEDECKNIPINEVYYHLRVVSDHLLDALSEVRIAIDNEVTDA